jgi:hypothetical protein
MKQLCQKLWYKVYIYDKEERKAQVEMVEGCI